MPCSAFRLAPRRRCWSQPALLALAEASLGRDAALRDHLDGDALDRFVAEQRDPNLFSIYRLWPMLVTICLGTWAGAGLLQQQKDGSATLWLGAALILYALVGLKAAKLRVPAGWESWLGPIIGFTTGIVTAATGVFVLPAVPYLQALGFDKDELVQALGISFIVSTLALSFGLIGAGALNGTVAWQSLLALVPALIGMGAGQFIRSRISPTTFKICFFAGLLALGAYLCWRSLG